MMIKIEGNKSFKFFFIRDKKGNLKNKHSQKKSLSYIKSNCQSLLYFLNNKSIPIEFNLVLEDRQTVIVLIFNSWFAGKFMSLCKRLHSWFRKQDKKVKGFEKGSQENVVRDIYCPINFEKMLRNYDIPSQTQKVKKEAKVEVQPKKYSLLEKFQEEQVDKQSKEDFNCLLNEREKQNENKENFNQYNFIPEVIQNEKIWKLDQQRNLNILQEIKFKNEQLCESEIFSSPQKPFEVLPFHPIIPSNKEENYEKFLFEQVMPKVETKQNNYSDSNKSFQMQAYLNYIPELKTKLSIRTIENKIKKGYSLRKIANQLIHYKYYQFCKVNQNINFEELHELIMSFLKKKFPQSI